MVLFRLLIVSFILVMVNASCSKKDSEVEPIELPKESSSEYVSAVDISSFPEIELSNPIFYNSNDQEDTFLNILKSSGVNTIRLKLWVSPENRFNSLVEVKRFSDRLKKLGFKIWITVHYSDTWADPGNQKTPKLWENLTFKALKDSVASYTKKIVEQINPEFIQIGNEVNSGFIHPMGDLSKNKNQFLQLMTVAISEVRENAPNTKIIVHFAGIENSNWFFNQINNLDYDIIGLSYYPIWHGKDLTKLKDVLIGLASSFNKKVVIAETAYPFTLDWNDWTNNIVGDNSQIIPSQFSATPQGQKKFVSAIKKIITEEVEQGIGFCYWGGELIAWKSKEAKDASPWENQALFDFNNKSLPVLHEFQLSN